MLLIDIDIESLKMGIKITARRNMSSACKLFPKMIQYFWIVGIIFGIYVSRSVLVAPGGFYYIFAVNTLPHLLQWNFCFFEALLFTSVNGCRGFKFTLILVFSPICATSVLPQNRLGHFIFLAITFPYFLCINFISLLDQKSGATLISMVL